MKKEDLKQCSLPRWRTGRIGKFVDALPLALIGVIGLVAYGGVVLICSSVAYSCSSSADHSWVKFGDCAVLEFWDIVYFNFITILTIGYGDYVPNGDGARALAVIEAVLGTGIITLTLSALIAKLLSPPKDAIVFSRFAYYCTEGQRFMVIYLNTTRNRVVNADISAYFKLAGDWEVGPPVRSPLVTRAVQTFYNASIGERDIVDLLDVDHPDNARDLLRFGISGRIAGNPFSAAIEYPPLDIIVLPNRDVLTAYPGFWTPNFKDPEFQKMFHYRPESAPNLVEYVKQRRLEQSRAGRS